MYYQLWSLAGIARQRNGEFLYSIAILPVSVEEPGVAFPRPWSAVVLDETQAEFFAKCFGMPLVERENGDFLGLLTFLFSRLGQPMADHYIGAYEDWYEEHFRTLTT